MRYHEFERGQERLIEPYEDHQVPEVQGRPFWDLITNEGVWTWRREATEAEYEEYMARQTGEAS